MLDDAQGSDACGVFLDRLIADENDGVGPLFDWYGNGDVTWCFEDTDDECPAISRA